MRIQILGVYIDSVKKKYALAKIKEWLLSDQGQYKIFTPNPEFLVEAYKNPKFRRTLNKGDLNLPDGIGLKMVAPIFGDKIIERISGVDFMLEICDTAQKNHKSIYLLGGRGETARKTSEILIRKYPNLIIKGASQGLEDANSRGIENQDLLDEINGLKPDILFVAFGHPKQEFWIENNLSRLLSVKIAMGVGGSFDYISGKVKRAPRYLRNMGFEWLYRLAKEPRRFTRIINAVLVFPVLAIKWILRSLFIYRPNVVMFLFKSPCWVLVVRRNTEEEHWQIPQGGKEAGETSEQALMREAKEELGTNDFKILRKVDNFFSYKWKNRKYEMHYGNKGQKQTIFFLEFTGSDSAIKLDLDELLESNWVKLDTAPLTVHTDRLEMTQKAVNYFKKNFKEL